MFSSNYDMILTGLGLHRCDSAVLSGVTLMLFACIVWFKLESYAHSSYDVRELAKSLDKSEALSSYWNTDDSHGDSFKSLIYFMVAPTLCYQKGWVVRQFIMLVIFTGFMEFIVEQYINPIVRNSQHPLKGNLLYTIERVLKLSVPNLYVWLCMFYCLFHLWLNILAEFLRFGDREFYKDWWNAKTVEKYWRMWNMVEPGLGGVSSGPDCPVELQPFRLLLLGLGEKVLLGVLGMLTMLRLLSCKLCERMNGGINIRPLSFAQSSGFHSSQPYFAPRSFFGVEDFLDDDNSRPYTYQKEKKSKNLNKHGNEQAGCSCWY
ncbi:unnamed protein product [Fraxinus pennsylvanica]|uniref:diacylglycerol O-acyltransferase n=1 Tax=Fraxinus pennsylvanica TaxID=56036 RepID=A0AAD2AA49_9LAMI|nr:unnamed protein product [Fraxinus pennsylvanica]